MHIVAVHGWQKEEATVAKTVADALGTVVFETRQKLAGGGPAIIASFADPHQAETLAAGLSREGVPAMVIDTLAMRDQNKPLHVRRFELGDQALKIESLGGDCCDIDYGEIELLLVAICSAGQTQTTGTVNERKFSIGKTLLAGGVPMTRKVTREQTLLAEVRDESLWLYARGRTTAIFGRTVLNYEGLGASKQLTRDLNFAYLKNELRRRAPQARYDDRLLKRATMVRVLGPALNPETNFDLAFEILSRSLRPQTDFGPASL